MDNDVAGNVNNNNIGSKKLNFAANNSVMKQNAPQNPPSSFDNAAVDDTLESLAQMGQAQVRLNKAASDSIRASVDEMKKDTEFASAHVYFCDSLVEMGYDLPTALEKTDRVFDILHQDDTYK